MSSGRSEFMRLFEEVAFDLYERDFSPFPFVRREGPRTEEEKSILRGLISDQLREDEQQELK